ncbi:twin-arginine translocase subunit TatC [Deinococcus pimensis]|uniref:twin-arginine translocase subunit TatC n=1 Tax=Deinococcus pimensis TaxID=309888 RepID=UPI0004840824|nr:twin-arginine translocase subunit TatC [Deinococcus pimensis]
MAHLKEFRWRVVARVTRALGVLVTWTYRSSLIELLQRPLSKVTSEVNLVSVSLTDQLTMSLHVALWGGLTLALPGILGQVWGLVRPALTREERSMAVPFVLSAGGMLLVGGAFAYVVVLPSAVPYLLDFLGGAVTVNLSLASYVAQVVTTLTTFGLLFELPVAAFVLGRLGVVSAGLLSRARQVAALVILVVSAVVTPAMDPLNLLLMAALLYLLYEVSIVVVRFTGRVGAA